MASSISLEQTKSSAANGVVANLEAQAEEPSTSEHPRTLSPEEAASVGGDDNDDEGERMGEDEEEDVEESDDVRYQLSSFEMSLLNVTNTHSCRILKSSPSRE